MFFFHPLLGSCSCHCHVRPGRMCSTGSSLSAQHSQVAAELPVLLGAGDAGLLLVLSCLTSCPMSRAAIQNGAFPSGWEEQLSLGNVKEGM